MNFSDFIPDVRSVSSNVTGDMITKGICFIGTAGIMWCFRKSIKNCFQRAAGTVTRPISAAMNQHKVDSLRRQCHVVQQICEEVEEKCNEGNVLQDAEKHRYRVYGDKELLNLTTKIENVFNLHSRVVNGERVNDFTSVEIENITTLLEQANDLINRYNRMRVDYLLEPIAPAVVLPMVQM